MGKIIFVDKPKGITSFDVCFKLRKVFNTRKIGHTGTLDPNATGLMIVMVDNAVKANQFLVSATKEYIATVKLGIKTDSDDIDGKLLEEKVEVMPDKGDIIKALNSLLGKSKQIPPMTSAVQVKGKRLFQYKREGKEIEVEARDIEVFEMELLTVNADTFTFRTKVSSGTFIRTLAQAVLAKLQVIGTLVELRRTKIDNFSIEEADELIKIQNGEYHEYSLYDVLSKQYQVYEVPKRLDVVQGRSFVLDAYEQTILCAKDQEALAIYRKKEDGRYYSVRGLF